MNHPYQVLAKRINQELSDRRLTKTMRGQPKLTPSVNLILDN
ncbi:MAG: hypothetical protein AB4063_04745 [Crocosphaera sp.]